MTERQFEGRSAAEAAIKACEVLGVTRSALRYKVVSETGELLSRRVVIAVEVDPAATTRPTAPDVGENEDPPLRSGEGGEEGEARHDRGPRSDRGGRSRDRDRGGRGGDRGGRGRERSARGDRGGRGDRGDRGDRGRRSGRGGDRQRHDDDGIEALLNLDATASTQPRRPTIEAKTPRAKRAVEVANDLTRLMGMELKGQLVSEDEAEMHVDLVGKDEARVIGKKGEVLLALQFVLNRILSRGEDEGEQVVVLDAGGYRERRRVALEELAKRLASRAVQERKAVRLSPMSAHDRRVFHMTLKEMEGVTTRSEGDGLFRNLLIIPSEFC
jgi:spoIIIJ-associated protein